MALSITHPEVGDTADDPNAEINKGEWNAAHTITMAGPRLLGAETTGPAVEIPLSADFAISAGTLTFVGAAVAGDLLSTLTAAVISITGAIPATISRMHDCSGTTANYDVALPTAVGNAGKWMGFTFGASTSLTKMVWLDGNGTETIGGSLRRGFWSGESLFIYSNGANWVKGFGQSIPMAASIYNSANQTVTTGPVFVEFDGLLHVDSVGMSNLMSNLANDRIDIFRPGIYRLEAGVSVEAISGGNNVTTSIYCGPAAATQSIPIGNTTQATNTRITSYVLRPQLTLALADQVKVKIDLSITGGNLSSYTNFLSVTEIISW